MLAPPCPPRSAAPLAWPPVSGVARDPCPFPTPAIFRPMSPPPEPPRVVPAPVVAGSLMLGSMVLVAAIGFGLGSLVGAAVPLGLAGLFAGLIAGFVLVHDRFRDL